MNDPGAFRQGVYGYSMFEALHQIILFCAGILPVRVPDDRASPQQAAHHTTNFVFSRFETATFLRVTFFGKPLIYGG